MLQSWQVKNGQIKTARRPFLLVTIYAGYLIKRDIEVVPDVIYNVGCTLESVSLTEVMYFSSILDSTFVILLRRESPFL